MWLPLRRGTLTLVNVAITGSHGLIGTALTRALRGDGHRVLPVVRSNPTAGEPSIQWDPAAGTIDRGALRGLDAVVHLAGAGIADKRWTDDRKREILESRTAGTTLLAEALARLPGDERPSALVSGSAIGYYGDRGDDVLTETSGPGDLFLSEVCTKWELATRAAEDAGIRVAKIRTGIVLSSEGGALKKQLPLFKLFLGGRLGSGRQYQSWISIDDEVGAIRWLIDRDLAGPFNLTAPEPVTNAVFTSTLAKVLGRPSFVPVPSFGPKLLLGGELAQELLFASERVVPEALTKAGFKFRHRDLETALRAVLGRPTELA